MQLFLENYKPKRPYATNDYSTGLYQRDRETALSMKHIETSPRAYQNTITLDVDIPDARWHLLNLIEDEKIPAPNFITENPNTEHAHATYLLKFGVSGEKPQAYAKDVRTRLTIAASADLAYNNRTFRNPLYFPTQTMTDRLYTLEDLNDLVKDVQLPKRNTDHRADPEKMAHGRNAGTFELLRHFAYANWYAFRNNSAGYEAAIMEKAFEINCTHEKALPPSEVITIVASVIRFVNKNFSEADFIAIQSARGVKSGKARRLFAEWKYNAVTASMAEGMTMKDACEGLNINYSSYRAAKKKYEEWFGQK
jgi:hypothetical protein